MATTKIVLRAKRPDPQGLCLIYVRYTHKERSMLISTSEKVAPEHFEDKTGRVRKAVRGFGQINDLVSQLRDRVETLARALKLSGIDPSLEAMREQIAALSFQEQGKQEHLALVGKGKTLLLGPAARASGEATTRSALEAGGHQGFSQGSLMQINKGAGGSGTGNDAGSGDADGDHQPGGPASLTLSETLRACRASLEGKVAAQTLAHYRTSADHLARLAPRLTAARADAPALERITDQLFELGLQPNSVGTIVKTAKASLAWADRHGHAVHPAYLRWKKPVATPDIVALSASEFEAMTTVDLSAEPASLEAVRAGFVFSCLTGLRYSDLRRFGPEHIAGEHIVMRAQKTGKALRVPLSSPALALLARQPGGVLGPLPTLSKANEKLKRIARLAGLTSALVVSGHKGRLRTEKVIEKWQAVSTHTARRSFVTLSLERGLRPEVLMKVTGHSELRTMMRYVSIVSDKVAEEMKKAWG